MARLLDSLQKTASSLQSGPFFFWAHRLILRTFFQQIHNFHRLLFNEVKLFGQMMHKPILTVTKLTRRGHHKAPWVSTAPLGYTAPPSGTGFIPAHAQQHISLAVQDETPLSRRSSVDWMDQPGNTHAAHGHGRGKAASPSAFAFLLLNMNLWPDHAAVHPPFVLEQQSRQRVSTTVPSLHSILQRTIDN